MKVVETSMKLSVKSMAFTSAVLWGGSMLVCGLINLASPSYGRPFLKLMSSVYPGYHNSRTWADVLVGASYAAVDGAAGGALLAALYNRCAGEGPGVTRPEEQPLAQRL